MSQRKTAPSTIPAHAAAGDWKYWHVRDAVRALDGSASIKNIVAWLGFHYPDENHEDARANASLLSVNDANRRHYDTGRSDFRSNQGNPKDALFKVGRNHDVRYELYDPQVHGIWDLKPEEDGSWRAIQIAAPVSVVDLALHEAQEQITAEIALPVDNEHDARVRELRAVALRAGQTEFRAMLLDAYDRRCAITDCGVLEILEAAHICPFRGEHTNRVDNGLLLRTDLHTLFDKGLVYIDSEGCVQLDIRLLDSEYAQLRGRRLRLPIDPAKHPHPEHLAYHRRHTAGCCA